MIIWDSSALQYLGNMTAAQRGYVNVIPVLCNYVGVLVASVSEKVVGQNWYASALKKPAILWMLFKHLSKGRRLVGQTTNCNLCVNAVMSIEVTQTAPGC